MKKTEGWILQLTWFMEKNTHNGLIFSTGFVLFWILKVWLEWHLAFLVTWNVLAAIYLSLSLVIAFNADANVTRERMAKHKSPLRMLISVIITAMLSNMSVGLFVSYHTLHHQREVLLCALAILQAWLLMHSAFGRYYGEIYYAEDPEANDLHRGLRFHGTEEPTQLDFDYLAFMIALSYSSGDVDITRHAMRKIVLLHSLISFMFYSTVVTGVLSAAATST